MDLIGQVTQESSPSVLGSAPPSFGTPAPATPHATPHVTTPGGAGELRGFAYWDVTSPGVSARRALRDTLLANVSHPLVEQTLRQMLADGSEALYYLAVDALCELARHEENDPITARFEAELIYMLRAGRGLLPGVVSRPLDVRSRREEIVLLALHRVRSRAAMLLLLELMAVGGPRLYDEAIDFDFDYDRRDDIRAALRAYCDRMSRQGYPVSTLAALAVNRAESRLDERYANRFGGFEPLMIGPHTELGGLYQRIARIAVLQGSVKADARFQALGLFERIRSRLAYLPDEAAWRAIRNDAAQIEARVAALNSSEHETLAQAARDVLALQLPARVRILSVPPEYHGPRLRFYRCDDPLTLLGAGVSLRPPEPRGSPG